MRVINGADHFFLFITFICKIKIILLRKFKSRKWKVA